MMKRRAVWIFVACLAAGAVVRADEESLRITPFLRDQQVLVSFELRDAYTAAVKEAIASGLRTTFTYDLELRTVVPIWVDRTIAHVTVSTTDLYDNLTRRHTLTRIIDSRIEEVVVTEDE